MTELKEMSYQEKYSQVLDFLKLEDQYSDFIEQQMGNQALNEFQEECQKGIKPISDDASYEEKYEAAFGNWAWKGGTKFSFVRNRLGEEGVDQLVKFEVEVFEKDFRISNFRSEFQGGSFSSPAYSPGNVTIRYRLMTSGKKKMTKWR